MEKTLYQVQEKTIVIKPVDREKFSGQSSYPNTGTSLEGAQLGKQGYKTGLSLQEEVTFCDQLGLPVGTLSKSNDKFWSTILNMRLSHDKLNTLHVHSLMDEIKYRVILNNSRIAKSFEDLKKTPLAEFYIEDREAAAVEEEKVIDFKMVALNAFNDMSATEKKGFLKLYGKRGADTMSDAFVKTALFKEVDNNPRMFMEFVNSPDIKLRIDIEGMVEEGALVKKGNFYSFQGEVIGNSIEAVISFFKDVRNQSAKIAATHAAKESKKAKGSKEDNKDTE